MEQIVEYDEYEHVIKPHAAKMYEQIAKQPELRHGNILQREMYRRAINIVNGIRKSKCE